MNLESTQAHRFETQKGMLNLRDILTVLFKYKYSIITVSFLIVLASLVLAFSQKPGYEAEISLLVKVGREHLFTSEANDGMPRLAMGIQAIVGPELTILASKDLRQRVLEEIGVNQIYPDLLENAREGVSPMPAALSRFKANLNVEQRESPTIIRVTFQHDNPIVATKSLNILAKFWKEKHLKVFSTPQTPFLQKQAESYRKKLNHTEDQLQQFKQEHGISSFPKQRALLLEQRHQLDTTLKSVENKIQSISATMASLYQQIKTIPKEIPISMIDERSDIIGYSKRELFKLQREERELSAKYQDKSRPLIDLRKEIGIIQTFLDEQEAELGDTVTSGRNPVYQKLELELLNAKTQHVALQSEHRVLTKQLKGLSDQVSHVGQLEQRFDSLVHEAEKDRENLSRYMEKVETATITEELDRQQIANVSVIQTATVSFKSVKTKQTAIVILGLMLGIASSIGLVFILEHLQQSYTRPEQVTHELGLPILVSVTNKR